MFTIGNDELEKLPPLGKTIRCGFCGKIHHVKKFGNKLLPDGSKELTTSLAFYRCGPQTYLAGVQGKDVRR